MKILIGVIIVAVCTLFGAEIGRVYKSEREILADVRTLCESLQKNLDFSKKVKSEIFAEQKLESQLKKAFEGGEFLPAGLEALPLNDDDKEKIGKYFSSFGEDFSDREKEKAEEFMEYLKTRLAAAEKNKAVEKAGVKLGVLFGALIFIVIM